jgi:hypothetical protein
MLKPFEQLPACWMRNKQRRGCTLSDRFIQHAVFCFWGND